jgi:octopine oxidase subunit B
LEPIDPTSEFDVAVVGGGLVGSAIAWGLAKRKLRVAVLDEGDAAFRASRGNFALVWVQSKGMGMPRYSAWTVRSANAWSGFAQSLEDETGIDVAFQRPGGLHVVLTRTEWERRVDFMRRLVAQPGMEPFEYEMLDHDGVARLIPQIGPEVVGASYCPLDGHCNALRLFRALNSAIQKLGVRYFTDRPVRSIDHTGGEFRLSTTAGVVAAGKVVLAAGLDNARLGSMVGLHVPVYPQRGQMFVTEKVAPFLHYPVNRIRQTDEGGVMVGDSMEDAGLDSTVGLPVLSVLADRAQRSFPQLGMLNVVRTWACLRVMTPDGFPIYDQSETCPGAFVATCHSGVTLAANHALVLPQLIDAGRLPADSFQVFSSRRFNVQAAA